MVFGILVTLVAWLSFRFFPSCPSCLAKCKQRFYVIFLLPKVTKNKNEKWDERNKYGRRKRSIKICSCLQFVCWSLSWELGDGVSIAKRNVVVFPPSTTYRHSLKEEKLHFLFGVIMALRSWWLICLVTFREEVIKLSYHQLFNVQNCQTITSSKKQTKEFVFLSWRLGNPWNLNFDFKFQVFSSRLGRKTNAFVEQLFLRSTDL